jgi:hypothetical protein
MKSMRIVKWLGWTLLSTGLACVAACGGDDTTNDNGGCCGQGGTGGTSNTGGTTNAGGSTNVGGSTNAGGQATGGGGQATGGGGQAAGGGGQNAGGGGMAGTAGTAGMGGTAGSTPDASTDAHQDAQAESAADTGSDGGPDVTSDASQAPDVSSDGAVDSGVGSDAADAGTDAGDGATMSQTEAALNLHAPACLTCARGKTACRLLLNNFACDDLAGNAAAGPAAGQSKTSLCLALLACELSTTCAGGVNGTSDCYCGTVGDTCFTAGGDGMCKSDEEKGLESTTPATIEGSYSTTSLGGGRANALVQCLADNNCSACF